jgi:DNA-binding transcriptional MerR regulator/methylmalonyl-CoA mutase cobalamin-binding subunit
MAGINPTLLRAWERRYHLVSPQRTASGYRVYSPEDVELLKDAAQLVAAGHSISEVARLSRTELRAAAGSTAPLAPAAGAPGGSLSPGAAGDLDEAAIATALAGALHAVAAFDRQQFEAALFPVTAMAGLGPVALCDRVLLPLLRQIGDGWERGQLSVAAEHFGSALCRAKILQCLEFVARTATGPRVVCACPENELHEGGLLAFAVHAAVARWQVVYLGGHTPLGQALDTAIRIAADMLALSLTIDHGREDVAAIAAAVRAARQKRPSLRVMAGGPAALAHRAHLSAAGIEVSDVLGAGLHPGAS